MSSSEARLALVAHRAIRAAYRNQQAHRAVPMPLARHLIEWQAQQALTNPVIREAAERQMRFLLGRSARALEAEDLAANYVHHSLLRAEYRWRPWLITRQRIVGIDHLQQSCRDGRGVILNSMHHGYHGGFSASFANAGIPLYSVAASNLLRNPSPAQAQLARVLTRHCRVIDARGCYPHLVDLMRRGQTVSLTNDLPGSCPMTIFGRPVLAASGVARLALETGAAIVPITAHKDGRLQYLRVQERIDPMDFGEITELQQEIARRHERALLDWPEAVEQPLRRWLPAEEQDVADFAISETEREGKML